ncbi:MAG TPA: DUF3822 family protein [Flavobacteriaceae bacterium]|nr:DUF3822 family protein [Flavobacteriaceae bacterium]
MIEEIKKKSKNNLDLNNLKEHNLSIQLSLDGFSFCVQHAYNNEIVAFSSYKFQHKHSVTPEAQLNFIKKIYKNEPLLNNTFKAVQVAHFNNLITQVPKAFFDSDKLSDYLKFTVKVLDNDYITYDEVANNDFINVYIPFVNINNYLLDKYGTFTFKHSSTVLFEKLLNDYKNVNDDYIIVNVFDTNFELLAIEGSKFKLFNNFSFNTKEDFIYYILFTAEQLKLNPEAFHLVLMGDIEKESELYAIAYQYIRNVSFYNNPNFPNLLDNSSSHNHFTVLNQF